MTEVKLPKPIDARKLLRNLTKRYSNSRIVRKLMYRKKQFGLVKGK